MLHIPFKRKAKKNESTFPKVGKMQAFAIGFRGSYPMYILLAPAFILVLIFCYIPMPGILIAFKDYDILAGFANSPWVGLKHMREIFSIPSVNTAVLNTLHLSALYLSANFVAPIVLALLFNELKNGLFKRAVQTISYLPHFLSWISIIGIAYTFFATDGTFNDMAASIFGSGYVRENPLVKPEFFISNILLISVWKSMGWSSILYLAAMSSIDPMLYEAARMDGAGRFRGIWHITLPGIMPTAMMILILSLGGLFSSNFELVLGLQNPFISFETIDTIVYKHGILAQNYSMATAISLMQGLVAFILIFITNTVSKKLSKISLF